MRQDRGFDSSHVTLAQVDLFTQAYDKEGAKGNAMRMAVADRMLAGLAICRACNRWP